MEVSIEDSEEVLIVLKIIDSDIKIILVIEGGNLAREVVMRKANHEL